MASQYPTWPWLTLASPSLYMFFISDPIVNWSRLFVFPYSDSNKHAPVHLYTPDHILDWWSVYGLDILELGVHFLTGTNTKGVVMPVSQVDQDLSVGWTISLRMDCGCWKSCNWHCCQKTVTRKDTIGPSGDHSTNLSYAANQLWVLTQTP